MTINIAIIGRPNVGKSTLFNRMVGKKIAIVDPAPGVTRDRREGRGRFGDFEFVVTDTAGLEGAEKNTLQSHMMEQTAKAVKNSDVVLLVIDGKAGLTPDDEHFANWVRKQKRPILLVVNKCEGKGRLASAAEAYALGFGDPIMISAEHGEGIHNLFDEIITEAKKIGKEIVSEESAAEAEKDETLRVTIAGRPNVGKSTFMNAFLGEERSITGSQPGITRDAIVDEREFDGKKIQIVDTAGMRKKSNIQEKIERMSIAETTHAIRFSHIVVLIIDATLGIEKQDLAIADLVEREGRGLIIALNKWDAVKDKKKALEEIHYRIEKSLPQVMGLPVVPISALKKTGIDNIFEIAFELYEVWNMRINTGKLNNWLEHMLAAHTPPLVDGRRIKIRYMTQVGTRPPRFALFTNQLEKFPEDYMRYLVNGMRQEFGLHGTPIRVFVRKGDNPFKK